MCRGNNDHGCDIVNCGLLLLRSMKPLKIAMYILTIICVVWHCDTHTIIEYKTLYSGRGLIELHGLTGLHVLCWTMALLFFKEAVLEIFKQCRLWRHTEIVQKTRLAWTTHKGQIIDNSQQQESDLNQMITRSHPSSSDYSWLSPVNWYLQQVFYHHSP